MKFKFCNRYFLLFKNLDTHLSNGLACEYYLELLNDSHLILTPSASESVEEKDEERIPWREIAKERIRKYSEPGLMLRGARVKEGLSQIELAEIVGITQSNLSKMERGKRSIGKQMAKRLAIALKIDYRTLL